MISGDNPYTVGAVVERTGLADGGEPVDARDLPDEPGELGRVLEEHSVFGRVTPHQKAGHGRPPCRRAGTRWR